MTKAFAGARRGRDALYIGGFQPDALAQRMKPLDLSGVATSYNEGWLQDLVDRFPQILPVWEVEPGFGAPVAACRELAVRTGSLDNLFVTSDGDLILAECKLWKNPEARREVVAQIIDYAHCLAGWTYEDLDSAVRKARGRKDGERRGLYDLVSTTGEEIDEAAFADAVTRNLRLGRFLLLIVGDGIHESAETLAAYLQEHAGFHFTLALVEMRIHELPVGGFVVAPQVLARTLNIERGIVRVDDGRPVVVPAPEVASTPRLAGARGVSISEERLFEALAAIDPTVPERLRAFADRLADLGVRLEPASRSLVLRWRGGAGRDLNLAYIKTDGTVWTDNATYATDAAGRADLGHAYLAALAESVGGTIRKTKNPAYWYVVKQGTQPPQISELLGRADAWAAAVDELVSAFREASDNG